MLTTLTMEITLGLYYVGSSFDTFLANTQARKALSATMLQIFPIYQRRNSNKPSSGFKVFFTSFAPIRGDRRGRNLLRSISEGLHLTQSTSDISVTLMLSVTTEVVSHDVLVTYAYIKDTILSSVTSGEFSNMLRAQAVLAGDASLATVILPTDPVVYVKFQQALAKSSFPTGRPTGQPTARPSLRYRPPYAVDNTNAYVLAISLGMGMVAVSALLVYFCCYSSVVDCCERTPFLHCRSKKAKVGPESGIGADVDVPRPENALSCGDYYCFFKRTRVVAPALPAPLASPLPVFSAREERKAAEEFEPILPMRGSPTRIALAYIAAPLPDLGLCGPPPAKLAAMAIEGHFAKKLHLHAAAVTQPPQWVPPLDSFVLTAMQSQASRKLQQQSDAFRALHNNNKSFM